MRGRRAFLAGAIAAGLVPTPTWAEAGSPRYLSAAQKPDGRYALFGLNRFAEIAFEVPLPARGHAAAAHPYRPEAVAFARRPGTYALVVDCRNGQALARLSAPEGRHFYGHGAFSADGERLYTTENDYENATGIVGVWDARRGYARVDEFPSGGIGPHDIKLLSHGEALAVANGGIETHPDTGRTKLNIPTMRPNLSIVSLDGRVDERLELDASLHKNSIRHLAVGPDGLIAFAMQWQGDATETVPLLGVKSTETPMRLFDQDLAEQARLLGYAGSVALDKDGQRVAITSPNGGLLQSFRVATGRLDLSVSISDVCGVAAADDGYAATNGEGLVSIGIGSPNTNSITANCKWDNHLVMIDV